MNQADAQRTKPEFQVHGLVVAADDVFAGAGIGVGFTPPGRTGLMVTATPGNRHGSTVRAEGLIRYRFDPRRRRGLTSYVGGGIGVETGRGSNPFLLIVVGIESRPGAGAGWFLETGAGGGIRLSVGLRVRPGPRVTS